MIELAHLFDATPPNRAIGVAVVFAIVYAGMFLGGLPKLKLDRSGVALLGAIAVIAVSGTSVEHASKAVDLPTIVLLFSFMVISAQMRLGGFYSAVTRRVGALPLTRNGLLAALLGSSAAMSAVFSNDIVCLAITPVVARICIDRGLAPTPFLIGLACAANIGSAATLIGNPQNMLIGSVMQLSFANYAAIALPPVILSLLILWLWLAYGPSRLVHSHSAIALGHGPEHNEPPTYDPVQSFKGLTVAMMVMLIFLFTDWPRELTALIGAGVLLLSRRLHSSHVMGFVDWQLLLLFIGLFVVNQAFQETGYPAAIMAWLGEQSIQLERPETLFPLGLMLSNVVSNVPAVMLLLPYLDGERTAAMLCLVSTFAGNLLLVGSIANLIVVDLARDAGIEVNWRDHARIGIPVTLFTLLVVWFWFMQFA